MASAEKVKAPGDGVFSGPMRRLLLLPLLFVGCYSYPSGAPFPGEDRACTSDEDCKAGRTCEQGECVGDGAGGSGGGGGGAGGGAACLGEAVECGCPGAGFTDGLSELRFFSCDEQRGTTIRGDEVVVADLASVCFGTLLPCERAGLQPLLDAGFLGCGATRPACGAAGDLFGWLACRSSDGVCVGAPFTAGEACGELQLQEAVAVIRDRVLRDGNCATP